MINNDKLKMIINRNDLDFQIWSNDNGSIGISINRDDISLYTSQVNDFNEIESEILSMIEFLIEMGDIDDPELEYIDRIIQEEMWG